MENNFIKVIDCFEIRGLGLLTEIQHHLNGIPPNAKLIDEESGSTWIVQKRVFHGVLLLDKSEVFFECETETTHVDAVFTEDSKRALAVKTELDKRKRGIYCYLLKPVKEKLQTRKKKKLVVKPFVGSNLELVFNS